MNTSVATMLPSCNSSVGQRMNMSCYERQEPLEAFSYDDATWVLTSSIVIFTMQTGKFD